jgi:hypothetical protein
MWRVLKHLVVLLLLVAVGGAAALAWLWLRSDELLRTELLRQAEMHLSGATITIERANFDLFGRVRIYNLAVHLPGEAQPALLVPETIITLDRQRFADHQQVILQEVRLNQPELRVLRDEQHGYAWSRVRWKTDAPAPALPDVDVAHGRIDFFAAATTTTPAAAIPIDDVKIAAKPASRQSYNVEVSAHTDVTGPVWLQGQVPLAPAGWQVRATAQQLRVEPATLHLAAILAPQLGPQLDQLQDRIAQQLVALGQPAPTPSARFDLGVAAVTKVDLQLAQAAPDEAPTFKLLTDWQSGRLTHPALPFPLSELRGKVYLDAEQIVIQGLQAAHGDRHLKIDAQRNAQGHWSGMLTAERAPIDDALVARLPANLRRHVDALALTGLISGTLRFSISDGQRWTLDADATLAEGTVRHERFPVLVRQVAATASLHDNVVTLHGEGRVGVTPVIVDGTLNNPGPLGSADFFIRADDFLLDDEILRACPESLQKTIVALRLAGRGDGRLRVQRPAGYDRKYHTIVDVRAREATLQYEGFPYPITDLSGFVRWEGDVVTFDKLHGLHDGAVLTGSGSYVGLYGPGRLQLVVDANDAAFDRALYAALPKSLRETWDAMSPEGQFSVRTEIDWVPGNDVNVVIPRMSVHRAAMMLRDFPFPWRDVTAELSYRDCAVEIREFTARHDDLEIGGHGRALCPVDRPWEVFLERLLVDDLTMTPALRRALPNELRAVVDMLNPQGRFSAEGPVAFFGPTTPDGMIGAAWKDLTVQLAGCSINAGLLLTEIRGRVMVNGRFDGVNTSLSGELDLDSLAVLVDHQVTQIKGPFKYQDLMLEVGSKELAVPPRGGEVPRATPSQRVIGRAYDGEITLDAYVDLREEPAYRTHLELNGASLEKYALRHLRGQQNVRGVMNGWMDVFGQGLEFDRLGGEGRLQISPAALYELPVFLQMFQLPQFAPIDRSAFNYANFVFALNNGRYDFQSIDLVGNTISLRGRGWIRYDGLVMLNFFTMQPRNRVAVPVLREVVGLAQMLGNGWIAVEVRGPITAPIAQVVPFPAVDEALRQFLGAMGPPPPTYRGAQRATDAVAPPRR